MKSWVSSAFQFESLKATSSQSSGTKRKSPQNTKTQNEGFGSQTTTNQSQSQQSQRPQSQVQQQKIDSDLQLCVKYEPKNRTELMVNKTKIDELSNYLDKHIQTKFASILLLLGPPGCGKTCTLKVLCKEKNINLIIWNSNQLKLDNLTVNDDLMDEIHGGKRKFADNLYQNQLDEFEQFLFKTSRYNTDQIYCNANESIRNKTIIFCKDIPLSAFYNETRFKEILNKFLRFSKCILVFSYDTSSTASNSGNGNSGSSSSWTTNPAKLFSNEFKAQLKINEILFNAFANSFLLKALQRVIQLDGLCINKDMLDNLCQMCNGDLRFAINSLEFYFHGNHSTKYANNASNNNECKKLLKTNIKDLNLNLFKGLGKILHRKHYDQSNNEDYTKEKFKELERVENNLPSHLMDKKRPPLSQQPEDIYNKLSISSDTILLFLQQNFVDMLIGRSYMLIDYTFDSIESIYNSFILSDILSKNNKFNSYNNNFVSDYSSIISMRSLLYNLYLNEDQQKLNATQSKGIFKPLYKPNYHKINETIKQRKTKSKYLFDSVSCFKNDNDFFQLYLPYLNILLRNTPKNFSRFKGHIFTQEQKTFVQSQFTFNSSKIKIQQQQNKLNANDDFMNEDENDDDNHTNTQIPSNGSYGKFDGHDAKLVKNRLYEYEHNVNITEVKL